MLDHFSHVLEYLDPMSSRYSSAAKLRTCFSVTVETNMFLFVPMISVSTLVCDLLYLT